MRGGFVITKIDDQLVKSVDDLKAALSNQSSTFQIQVYIPAAAKRITMVSTTLESNHLVLVFLAQRASCVRGPFKL